MFQKWRIIIILLGLSQSPLFDLLDYIVGCFFEDLVKRVAEDYGVDVRILLLFVNHSGSPLSVEMILFWNVHLGLAYFELVSTSKGVSFLTRQAIVILVVDGVEIREPLHVHEVIRQMPNVVHATGHQMVIHMTWIKIFDVATISSNLMSFLRDLIEILHCIHIIQEAIFAF